MNVFEKPVQNDDPDKDKADELVKLFKKITPRRRQVNEAYEIAMGIRERGDGPDSAPVNAMADKMSELMDAGMSANRIAAMIDNLGDIEDAPSRYMEIVERMGINEKGKKLLRSIIEKKRTGMLTFYNEKGAEIAAFEIRPEFKAGDQNPEEMLAFKLNELLSRVADKKVQISFTE